MNTERSTALTHLRICLSAGIEMALRQDQASSSWFSCRFRLVPRRVADARVDTHFCCRYKFGAELDLPPSSLFLSYYPLNSQHLSEVATRLLPDFWPLSYLVLSYAT
jgi:hypothetical protein